MDEFLQKVRKSLAVRALFWGGAVFLFLKFLVPLLSPFILAMLFLTIFGPLLQRLQRLHLHRQVGAVLILILALVVSVAVLTLLCHWLIGNIPAALSQAESWKEKLPDWADRWIDLGLRELKQGAGSIETGMLGGAIRYTGKLAAFGGYLITFLIAVVLLAKDYDELMNRLLEREDCHLLLSVICSVIRYIAVYVKAQGIIMATIAALCALVLSIAGIPQGVFWGLLAGVLDALPFIGTGVVLTPLALTGLFAGKVHTALLCAGLYVACVIIREMMEPRLIGKKMGVRPIAVLISLYVGIGMFGVSGIIKGPLGFVIIWETWRQIYGSEEQKVNSISVKK